MIVISFVIPVYNNENYLSNALLSIISQKRDEIEIIIVDDGSTDRTPQIADSFAREYSFVKVIHQENQWIYASMNKGVLNAIGEYVYILNSDDRLFNGSIDILFESIEKNNNPDVVWTKVILNNYCDKSNGEVNAITFEANYNTEDYYYKNSYEVRLAWPYFLKSNLAINQANLYKREIMLRHPFETDIYGADTLFNISIADEISSAVVIGRPIYEYLVYKQDSMNASLGKYYGYEHGMFSRIIREYWNLFSKWNIPKETYSDYLYKRRVRYLSGEIASLSAKNCFLTTEDKLKRIFCDFVDEEILSFANTSERLEEIESRVLSGTLKLLCRECLEANSSMSFVYDLLNGIVGYERDYNDVEMVKKAVFNKMNPSNIGKHYLERLENMY